jgi:AmiR/NasT family two-component response regulator
LETSPVRVLVVEDYEPFRRFVCSMLGKRPDLQVICEASDGLEAIQKVEELQPDLIVLAVGLPTLNGLISRIVCEPRWSRRILKHCGHEYTKRSGSTVLFRLVIATFHPCFRVL